MRTAIRVICDTGRTWVTDINGGLTEARSYFLKQAFIVECPKTGKEVAHVAIDVVNAEEKLFHVIRRAQSTGSTTRLTRYPMPSLACELMAASYARRRGVRIELQEFAEGQANNG